MARRKITFERGGYYHIYNRGANRARIFQSDENYRFLLQRMKERIGEFQTTVIAYCLMPNHYHWLLRQDGEKPLSAYVQAVFNSYSKAYNKMHERTGTLFEERFKAILVERDEYLLYLCRYIHRNPLEAGLVTDLEDWKFSNYPEWIGKRGGTLVDRGFVSEFFKSPKEYQEFVLEETLTQEKQEHIRMLVPD